MNVNDENQDEKVVHDLSNAKLFIERKGFKKSVVEYTIVFLVTFLVLFFYGDLVQVFGQLFLKNTNINLFEIIFELLFLLPFVYILWRHKFKIKEILSLFGLYQKN